MFAYEIVGVSVAAVCVPTVVPNVESHGSFTYHSVIHEITWQPAVWCGEKLSGHDVTKPSTLSPQAQCRAKDTRSHPVARSTQSKNNNFAEM